MQALIPFAGRASTMLHLLPNRMIFANIVRHIVEHLRTTDERAAIALESQFNMGPNSIRASFCGVG